ncbi:MgtE integral membrane region protein [Halorhabdus tiamatea SARL4B]|uniref:MgtE integral membrane region n=1 Tax=Halorhabdus tiamatea SARL4B TaxID=1033806 RepID=F7PK67_9EURY|nr:magnesium transporter [Halorhabdus tiamatea]ERJ07600.1 MgtE integral membrane region protein [Halorhabdus tiamatea SARL4B]CCQ33450.1 MgtE integral membrane region [Halorhabdus tiamatea SARL4B]
MTVRETAVRAYREGLPALSASLVGGLLAGVVLGGMRAELTAIDGLLVLVPALLATRGNVYGSLGARIATALHQGFLEPRVREADDRLLRAVAAAIANGLLASVFAAVVATAALTWLARPAAGLPALVAVAAISGLLSGIALATTVVVVVFAGFRRGYNPDTLVGPLVTTAGDVFGMAALLIAARLVIWGVG